MGARDQCGAKSVTTGGCWEIPARPAQVLLDALKAGPFAAGEARQRAARIAALRREDVTRPTIFVGAGTCGLGAGASKTLDAVRTYLKAHDLTADVVEVGCIGLCSEEPILDVQLRGRARVCFGEVSANKVEALLDQALAGNIPQDGLLGQFRSWGEGQSPWEGVPFLDEHPFLLPQKRWVLALCGIIDPNSIDEAIACGGYSALARTLRERTPEELCDIVTRSGLRGRGGAGFPTGRKWHLARKNQAEQKYLVCNADEGDPGAFMDRAVCESDPHRLLEGMIIAAYAIGASKAYIYIRAEYPLAVQNLRKAINEARAYGLVGTDILGSGFSFDIFIKMGAGAFVCGEETALIHSIEGKRGMPRPRPPYPVERGLFGKPTVINNVETLANLPTVMTIGAERFAAIGTSGSKGTKVFALSGTVRRTGLVEVPMGTALRQVVFDVGGGIPNNRRCKAVQIGGPSGGCIPVAELDLPTDYEALKNFGAIMGSGGLVVMDENNCMVDVAKFFMEFIQKESCGKCIPCREGTRRMLEVLQAITRSHRHEEDLDALLRFQGVMYLQELGDIIRKSSLCGLGQTAPNPVLSTLRWFRDEYEAHIFERRCPSGVCKELVGAPCQTGCPVGTEVWRYVAHIARGEYDDAYRVIREANPLPSVCARVCNHPCETVCRAGSTGGDPIAVRTLKRFAVDHAVPSTYKTVILPVAPHAPRVAIIGGGPSGLTAAHELSRRGYPVTLIEREAELGGMLLGGIPAYRLPRETLRREISSLLNENIQIRCNTALGRDVTVDGLFDEGFKAVYVAVGSHESHRLALEGEDAQGVVRGMGFLKAFNLHGEELARGRVGVIGGGNSAIDAARVAIRQRGVTGVTIFYRRSRDEMPAYDEEIAAALAEGVNLESLVTPVRLLVKRGRLVGVELIRNELGAPDASGRRRPIPEPGSEHEVELDTLVVAISEAPERGVLSALTVSEGATLAVNPESLISERPGLFGGGDVVSGPNTVIDAIAAGKRAARMIERYVMGKPMKLIEHVKLPTVYVEPVNGGEAEREMAAERLHAPLLPIEERCGRFCEVELCVSEQGALREARRCLRCDLDFTQPA